MTELPGFLSDGEKRHSIGRYGDGTLWSLKTKSSLFIFFKDTLIAKRGRAVRSWISLDPAWQVTTIDRHEIWVQHRGAGGVIVSLHGGGI
jgi:hypothetical protein